LASALDLLISDAALRHRLGASGRERVLNEFRWEEKLARVRQVYEEGLAATR